MKCSHGWERIGISFILATCIVPPPFPSLRDLLLLPATFFVWLVSQRFHLLHSSLTIWRYTFLSSNLHAFSLEFLGTSFLLVSPPTRSPPPWFSACSVWLCFFFWLLQGSGSYTHAIQCLAWIWSGRSSEGHLVSRSPPVVAWLYTCVLSSLSTRPGVGVPGDVFWYRPGRQGDMWNVFGKAVLQLTAMARGGEQSDIESIHVFLF
ncbi:hypothetical protein N658DRAFT_51111 [Parathielavia hyrcaniae]|uniref:Uncharacterized protein n=1 Tax=Parathielavia hyrcaniae TaxID=113614 RepID=A0AAN6Q3P0_9PEZI|nr:hypothetical protein N658DRAFT_51111 [Parathielavia hyrcaniae]